MKSSTSTLPVSILCQNSPPPQPPSADITKLQTGQNRQFVLNVNCKTPIAMYDEGDDDDDDDDDDDNGEILLALQSNV